MSHLNRVLLATVMFIVTGGCNTSFDDAISEVQEKRASQESSRVSAEPIKGEVPKRTYHGDDHPIRWAQVQGLKSKGLEHPVEDVISDLLAHPELIPFERPEGMSQFGFYPAERIFVLSDRYVHTYVEDGHVSGEMVLRYEVNNSGEISWTVVEAVLDN